MTDQRPTSKFSFGRAAAGSGLLKAGLGAAVVAGGAYVADQQFNDGRISDAVFNPDGYGKAWDMAGSGLSTVMEFTKAAGGAALDMAAGPMNGPAMGIAALFAGLAALSFTKDRFDNVPGGAVGRFGTRVGIALTVAMAAAGVVANLEDKPEASVRSGPAIEQPLPSASEDQRLQEPQQRLDSLRMTPPAPPGP